MLKACLVNFNYTPDWLAEFDISALIYDRSDSPEYLKDIGTPIIQTKNFGNVDYDKLTFLADYYDDLPAVFLWSKSNLFQFITKDEFRAVRDNTVFTPLIRQDHKTYSDSQGVVCYYDTSGMYYERADSWFFHSPELAHSGRFNSWGDWGHAFNLPSVKYIPFAPGGSYLLTREVVHRYGRDFYRRMADTLPYAQLPVEAHCAERSYTLLWR